MLSLSLFPPLSLPLSLPISISRLVAILWTRWLQSKQHEKKTTNNILSHTIIDVFSVMYTINSIGMDEIKCNSFPLNGNNYFPETFSFSFPFISSLSFFFSFDFYQMHSIYLPLSFLSFFCSLDLAQNIFNVELYFWITTYTAAAAAAAATNEFSSI